MLGAIFVFGVLLRSTVATPPHIIFIYADDLGWNDLSYHGSPEIPTPNIDALGLSGITLQNYYGEWLCTPSRGAFLTGKYPIRLGLQHEAILAGERSGLPLEERTLPQHLKKLGYATHMVGKWHLGYMTKEYTPTYRGFDTFFGYYNTLIEYYDYTFKGDTELKDTPFYFGIDIHNNTGHHLRDLRDFRSKYATTAFTERATDIIYTHDQSKPLFLYLAHLAVHAGHRSSELGLSPAEAMKKFPHIKDYNRRIHAARTSVLDDSVGTVLRALEQTGMLGNSIVVFASDNGGELDPQRGGFSSNHPFRGKKKTVWEGGYHIPALLFSPLLQLRGQRRVSQQWMHVTDWLPTLYSAAGGDVRNLGEIDGHDLWDALLKNSPSPRKNMLYNIDPVIGVSAYKDGDFKVVNGTVSDSYNYWDSPSGLEYVDRPKSMYKWVFRNGSSVRDILRRNEMWIGDGPDAWYQQNTVDCRVRPNFKKCDPDTKPCLFNLKDDPCEYHDLADEKPDVVKKLMKQIGKLQMEAAPPQSKPSDPDGNPLCYDFAYIPWMDPENHQDCHV